MFPYRYFDATKKMVFDKKSNAIMLETMMSFDLDRELSYIKYGFIYIACEECQTFLCLLLGLIKLGQNVA